MEANTMERRAKAAAHAQEYYRALRRQRKTIPVGTDAADWCGYCSGFGDGHERGAFIDRWGQLTAKVRADDSAGGAP